MRGFLTRYIVTCRIKGVHGVKKGVVLFFSWIQLQEHRLFHTSSIASIEKFVTRQEKPNPCPKQGTPGSSTAVETAWLPQAQVSVMIRGGKNESQDNTGQIRGHQRLCRRA